MLMLMLIVIVVVVVVVVVVVTVSHLGVRCYSGITSDLVVTQWVQLWWSRYWTKVQSA